MSENGKRRVGTFVTIAVVIAIVAVSFAYFVPGIHQKISVNYSEKTLFPGNNTLINGGLAQPSYFSVSVINQIIFDPIYNLVITDNVTNIFVINATTNSVVESIAYNAPPVYGGTGPAITHIFCDPLNGNIFFENNVLNKTQMINGSTLKVTNFSNLWKAFPVLYNPYNHYFYGPSLTNFSITVFNSSFSVVAVIPVAGFAIYSMYDFAYDSSNHDVYVLTSSMANRMSYYNISVISPENSIIATILQPLRGDIYITYLPAYESVFISNFSAIAEINASNQARMVQNISNEWSGGLIYSLCMNGSADYMLVLGNKISVLYNLSEDVGTIDTFSSSNPTATSGPFYGVYVPATGQYYISNQFSNGAVSIIKIWLTTQGLTFRWYNPFPALSMMSVAGKGR